MVRQQVIPHFIYKPINVIKTSHSNSSGVLTCRECGYYVGWLLLDKKVRITFPKPI